MYHPSKTSWEHATAELGDERGLNLAASGPTRQGHRPPCQRTATVEPPQFPALTQPRTCREVDGHVDNLVQELHETSTVSLIRVVAQTGTATTVSNSWTTPTRTAPTEPSQFSSLSGPSSAPVVAQQRA